MATDTLDKKHTDHDSTANASWDGAEYPFKVGYGKLMIWYFFIKWEVPLLIFRCIQYFPFSRRTPPTALRYADDIRPALQFLYDDQSGSGRPSGKPERSGYLDGLDYYWWTWIPRLSGMGVDYTDW